MCPCGYLHRVAAWQHCEMGYLTIQELATCAVLAVLTVIVSATYFPFPVAVSALVLTFLVAAITVSDSRHFIIPDVFSLPAIPLGIVASWFISGNDGGYVVIMGILGALLGGFSLYAIKVAYARLQGIEGLGLGDVKLFAAGGAWLGPESLAITLLLASLGALVSVFISMVIARRRDFTRRTAVPFGAFIAPAIWLVWIYQQILQYPQVGMFGS